MMDGVTKPCLTLAELAAFLGGRLARERLDRMVRHLNRCLECFERYIEAVELMEDFEAGVLDAGL